MVCPVPIEPKMSSGGRRAAEISNESLCGMISMRTHARKGAPAGGRTPGLHGRAAGPGCDAPRASRPRPRPPGCGLHGDAPGGPDLTLTHPLSPVPGLSYPLHRDILKPLFDCVNSVSTPVLSKVLAHVSTPLFAQVLTRHGSQSVSTPCQR